ncbi:MAG: sugar nucleotide-binding protein, partial [Acidobacteriota bacterium]|nr:sugar nucleotide-binding protein [Acidobacteriota bacterium]
IWASVTHVSDLAIRINEIIARHHYATYHAVNDGFCSHYDFAVKAARSLNLTSEEGDALIESVSESQSHRLAARPRCTPMRCLVSEEIGLPPMRHWHTALSDFLRDG